MEHKKIDPRIWWLIIIMLPVISVGTCVLSETFSGEGYMEAWHDSEKITDRTTAQGRYDYAAEVYPGGVSSGLNISNGTASYSFQSGDYSIRLKKFSGEIVAEADSNGTIIDLSGSGKMSAISYPTRPYASSVRPFPIGGLKGEGKLFLHVTTEFENIPIEMWNGTEWANTPVIDINQTPNQTTNETETIDSINDTTWIDGSDWDDSVIIYI